jgi:SAM-dependent methyltransferase
MSSTKSPAGSAERWGPLWGARPEDWAVSEDQQVPTYEEAIRRVGIEPGQRVLDVGCGAGAFLRLVSEQDASPFGLDASEELIELARTRLPEADLRVGDMQFLPYEDDSFDLVTGFNSFFFAADMVAALREAGRVAAPGAPLVIQVWGNPERCTLKAMKAVVRPFMPPRPPDAPPQPELWKPGALEAMARDTPASPPRPLSIRAGRTNTRMKAPLPGRWSLRQASPRSWGRRGRRTCGGRSSARSRPTASRTADTGWRTSFTT